MASDPLKPTRCFLCGALPCQGNCKKCPKRLKGECYELWRYDTYREGDNIIWFAICPACSKILVDRK